jgi:hypothetical protein
VEGANRFIAAESRRRSNWPYSTRKIEWQSVRSGSLVMSAQYGYFGYPDAGYDGLAPDKPSTLDIATQVVTGNSLSHGQRAGFQRYHGKAVVSWYGKELFAGNHEIKGGFDHFYEVTGQRYSARPSGEYQLRFNNGLPIEIDTRNTPIKPKNVLTYAGLYAQDNWRIVRSLTLSLGLRYDRNHGYVPAQCRDAAPFAAAACFPQVSLKVWNALAPRVHFAYDVFGDGKMAIKGGYGRFNDLRESSAVTGLNQNNLTTTRWRWRDLNGNRDYDRGEVNLDPNGPDFISIAGALPTIPNPNDKQPKTDEFSLTIEQELRANWAVRVSGFYSRNFNTHRLVTPARPYEAYNIPITRPDPGVDGRLGTADDPGTSITFYEYPVALRGRAFETAMLVNDPNANHRYTTVEVASTRRLANRWLFSASYSATKRHIPFAPRLAYNPNAEIFTANDTWEWIAKSSGGYALPYGIHASANFEHRSGDVGARQVLFTGGTTIPTIVLNVEPIGTQRNGHTNLLDFRGEKRFALGGRRTLDLRLELFNVFNVNTIKTPDFRAGPNFLAPISQGANNSTAIIPPRILEFIWSYTF